MLTRPFTTGGRHYLGVSVLGAFRFDAPERLMLARELWALAAEQLGPSGGVLDAGFPKVRAEVLLLGHAYPPERPARTCPVRVRVGAIDRTIYAIGDRRWVRGVPSEPEAFDAMPLGWERAFGGTGFAPNPTGKGAAAQLDGTVPLPNLERPEAMVRSPNDRPMPASFAPIDALWPQRAARGGTYDQRWLETEYPGFPSDFDPRFFNVAPEEQQLDGELPAGAPVELTHVHPTHVVLRTSVPTHTARCLVKRRGADAVDVALRKTTLWLFPEVLCGVVIHHGATPIAEDDGRDVEHVIVAADGASSPRTVAHFAEQLRRRTDRARPEATLQAILDDGPLLPEGQGPTFGDDHDREAAATTPHLLRLERQWKKARRDVDLIRAELVREGLDPDEYGPAPLPERPPPVPALHEIEALADAQEKQAEKVREDAEIEHAAAMAELDEALASVGMSERDRKKACEGPSGPPKLSAEAQLAELRAEAAQNPSPAFAFLHEMAYGPGMAHLLETAERDARAGYLRYAHHQAAIPEPGPELRAARRLALLAHLEREEPVREIDLSCADLSGLDLRGRDLRGAWLESADLSGADLRGARLDGAVLTRATIVGARLSHASLRGANLGGARVEGSHLDHADLEGAELSGSRFVRSPLAAARLPQLAPLEWTVIECDLEGADLRGFQGIRPTLERPRFDRANLDRAVLIETSLANASLAGARLEGAVLHDVVLDGACLDGASAVGAILVNATSLRGASLVGADLSRANLRALDMSGARLDEATLEGADLGESTLRGASLEGARARGLLAIRTDLAGASLSGIDLKDAFLSKADLRGADLRDASLFGSDLSLIRGDGTTRIDRADSTRARTIPRRREPKELGDA